MPLATYNLLKEIFGKRKELRTDEIVRSIAKKSPRDMDSLLINLDVLERMGFLLKRFDMKKNTYLWSLREIKLTNEELLLKYPLLYEQSLYGIDPLSDVKEFRKSKKS
ncbi:MAG: hypothetical protein J7K72_02840 [Candidatus Aenigmarchaeota archaeon]|nr:hypothetical protein [Candidatus Aenigmarchaeota archaeon]